MIKSILLAASFAMLLAACEYKVPITADHNIPVDPVVLGSWKVVPAENQDNDSSILIFRFSDTEYAVRYHEDGGDLYFRAYAIDIEGVPAVQLEWIGSDDGPVGEDDKDRYHVISYRIENRQLEIRMLNSDLVDDGLTDSKSLKKAFIQHKENPELFNDPGFFRRVED